MKWQFALWRTEEGQEIVSHAKLPTRWSELVEASRDCRTPHIPSFFREEPLLLLLFSIMFPYRCTPEVVRFLGYSFGGVWFIPPPVT
jgi:hypothetical protein